MRIDYNTPDLNDAADMWELAKNSGVDLNSSYSYLMMAEYFSDSCVIAEEVIQEGEDQILNMVGFTTGFILAKRPDTLFVWQVAVDDNYRGHGIAKNMIDTLVKRHGLNYVEATITPNNKSSIRLFKNLAADYNTRFVTDKGFFDEEHFPDDVDHEMEMLVQVGPIVERY